MNDFRAGCKHAFDTLLFRGMDENHGFTNFAQNMYSTVYYCNGVACNVEVFQINAGLGRTGPFRLNVRTKHFDKYVSNPNWHELLAQFFPLIEEVAGQELLQTTVQPYEYSHPDDYLREQQPIRQPLRIIGPDGFPFK